MLLANNTSASQTPRYGKAVLSDVRGLQLASIREVAAAFVDAP